MLEPGGRRATRLELSLCGSGQLRVQVVVGTELVPFQVPRKPNVVLAPAPAERP